MSQADKITWTRVIGPYLHVEVDDRGQIQVAVRSGSTRLDSRVDTDGWVRSDVSNTADIAQALDEARVFVAAVFPDGKQPPGTGEWRERRDAYSALRAAHKLSALRSQCARDVTMFLDEYKQAEAMAGEGHRPHMTMDKYAEEYERWF